MAGSIQKSGSNSWKLTVSAGFDGKGNRIRYTKTVKGTKTEAKKELARFVTEIETGQTTATGKMTFKGFAELWIKEHAKVKLSPKTVDRYIEILETRIYPFIGNKRLDQLKPVNLISFYNYLKNDAPRLDGRPGKLSSKTILQHHRIISSILQTAVHWQLIPQNVASRVKPPRVEKKEALCFDDQQTLDILQHLESEHIKYKVAITLALASGFRRGELMGLEWSDVNFNENTITVKRSSQYLHGEGIITKLPKTELSIRKITLPASTMKLLAEYKDYWNDAKEEIGNLWQGSDRLFVTWDGKPMHPDSLSSWFGKFLNRNNLPVMPFHALRHTAASLMINQGLELSIVSKRLGHADISTTGNIYGHIFKSTDSRAADVLDGIFSKINRN